MATPSGPAVRQAMREGAFGQVVTPEAGNRVEPGVPWILDNGCFSSRWNPATWQTALDRYRPWQPTCLFAVVPDVVADAAATDRLWARWWSAPMRRGYRCAYVLQNNATHIPAGAKAVFIGGDTTWKLGPQARHAIHAAKQRGLWVHMGRVNTHSRLAYAHSIGCDSVDGTCLTFAPTLNLPRLRRWLRLIHRPTLFD